MDDLPAMTKSTSKQPPGPASTAPPHILVVSCGGTISSVQSTTGGAATPRLTADELLDEVPQLQQMARLEAFTQSVVPSSNLGLADVLALHRVLEARVTGTDAPNGIVVTHGTDTLEETAFALDLLWDHEVPLVVTGAMRNVSLPGPDGPGNLYSAVLTAASTTARALGVLVVAEDVIHSARYVRKSHTHRTSAFHSPTVGPLGYTLEGRAVIHLMPQRREPITDVPLGCPPPVAILTMAMGEDDRLLRAAVEAGYGGIVIESLGGGHVPAAVAESPALEEAVSALPVVLASRTGAGEMLSRTYAGFSGSETDLLARGLINAGSLDGPKSRVLLSFLLAAGAGRPMILDAFDQAGRQGFALPVA